MPICRIKDEAGNERSNIQEECQYNRGYRKLPILAFQSDGILTGAVSSRPSKQQIVPDHIFLSFCKVQRRKVCTACQQVVQRYNAVDVPVHRPGVGRAVLVHVVYRAGFGVVGGQHAALLSVQDADIPHVLARHIALLCQLGFHAAAAEILAGRVFARAVAVFIAAALVHPHQPAVGKAGQGVVALPPVAGGGKAVGHRGQGIHRRVHKADFPALVVAVCQAATAALGQDMVVVSVADQVALRATGTLTQSDWNMTMFCRQTGA